MHNLRSRLDHNRDRLMGNAPATAPLNPETEAFEVYCSDDVRDLSNQVRTAMHQFARDPEGATNLEDLQHMLSILSDEAQALIIVNQ